MSKKFSMTYYDVESYMLADVVSVHYKNGKNVIDLINGKLTIGGKQLEAIWETLKEKLLKNNNRKIGTVMIK